MGSALRGRLEETVLDKAIETLGRKNEMVEEADAEELARFLEPLRDIHVLGRGFETAGGVVVSDDHRAGPVHEGVGKDFPRVDDRLIPLVVDLLE